jgi:hypothetical protein
VLLAVPAANALSLANFQGITSILIPISCQLTYDNQIPSCTVSDFNNGCSAVCVEGLKAIARSVSKSCEDVEVSSSTLLGIVMNGGIVAALCPTLAKPSTQATISVTVQSSVPTAQPAAVSVTIPTDSAGVTGGLGFKTSSTTTSTPVPVPQSEISTKMTSVKTTKTSSTTSQSVQSAGEGLGGGSPATTSTQTTAKKTTSAASTQTTSSQQSQDKSGGGSPFDTQSSNDATRDVGRSMLALVVAMSAVLVIGR